MRENQELYTKLSSQTKCITLELKPVGKTRQIIDDKGYIYRAEYLYTLAHDLYPVIDEFVKKAMSRLYEDVDEIVASYMEKEKEEAEKGMDHWDFLAKILNEDAQKYNVYEANLIQLISTAGVKKINELISEYEETYDIKKSCTFGSVPFISELMPAFLDECETFKSNKQEIIDNINELKGCNALFKGYYTSRITSIGAIAKRIFENFKKYIKNIPTFTKFIGSGEAEELLVSFPIFESFVLPSYYSQFISPSGINAYNLVINGKYDKDGVIENGYNLIYNILNQKHGKDKNNKKGLYSKAEPLWQQIFEPSERQYHIDCSAYSDEDARELIKKASNEINDKYLKNLTKTMTESADPEGIIVKYKKLHTLSFLLYDDHDAIPKAIRDSYIKKLEAAYDKAVNKKEKKKYDTLINKVNDTISKEEYSLARIGDTVGEENILKLYVSKLNELAGEINSIRSNMKKRKLFKEGETLKGVYKSTIMIRDFFDAVTEYSKALKIISASENEDYEMTEGNLKLFAELDDAYDIFREASKSLGAVRNYMRRREYDSTDNKSILLDFGHSTFLSGAWFNNDETIKTTMHLMFRYKDEVYYGVCTKPIKIEDIVTTDEKDCYYLFRTKKPQSAIIQLPKIAFMISGATEFFMENPYETEYVTDKGFKHPITISREIWEIYKSKSFSRSVNPEGYEPILKRYMEFLKMVVDESEQYERYGIKLKDAKDYERLDYMLKDINNQAYISEWIPCKRNTIEKYADEGRILLFKPTSRFMDSHPDKYGAYSTFFRNIFMDDKAIAAGLRLNSGVSVTYRKPLIKNKTIHKAGDMLVNRYSTDRAYRFSDEAKHDIFLYSNGKIKKEDMCEEAIANLDKAVIHSFDTDIIKDGRYTREMFRITIPYTVNYEISANVRINDKVNETLKEKNVLTITRGFKKMISYTVTSPTGEVLEKNDLNTIDNMDYRRLLVNSTYEKKSNSRDWTDVTSIKDIRKSYFQKAASLIIKIADRYDAVIVTEKISEGYRNKSVAFDNNAYVIFDQILEDQLKCKTEADAKMGEPGSIANPKQYVSGGYSTKPYQDGILFRLTGAYTYSTCPVTGFVNLFDLSKVNGAARIKAFLHKFDSITWSEEENVFLFKFDYKNFETIKKIKNSVWTLRCGGTRTIYNKGTHKTEYIENIADKLIEEFDKQFISYKGINIVDILDDLKGVTAEKIMSLLKTTLYSTTFKSEDEDDRYISPVMGITNYTTDQVKALNMFNKFSYYTSFREETDNISGFLERWIDYNIESKDNLRV